MWESASGKGLEVFLFAGLPVSRNLEVPPETYGNHRVTKDVRAGMISLI